MKQIHLKIKRTERSSFVRDSSTRFLLFFMAWHASTEEKESRVHMRTASLKDSPRLMRCRWHYSCDVHATEPRPSVPIPLQLKIFSFYILFPLKYSIYRHNTDLVSKRLPWMWSFQVDALTDSVWIFLIFFHPVWRNEENFSEI